MFLNGETLARIAFSILSVLFAVNFAYQFRRDNDEQKLPFVFSFFFLGCSSAFQIVPSEFYFANNLSAFEFIPLMISTAFIIYMDINEINRINKITEMFSALMIPILAAVFLPIDLSTPVSDLSVLAGLGILASSIFLFLKKRGLDMALITFAIASFLAYGFGWAFNMGLPFVFLSYAMGFVFLALGLGAVTGSGKSRLATLLRASEQLQELKVEYKTVFESASDAIFVMDENTNQILDCNPEASELLGLQRDEMVGKVRSSIVALRDFGLGSKLLPEGQYSSKKVIETRIKTSEGVTKDVAIKFGSFIQGDKDVLVGVFRDVTDQKRTNEKLKVVGSLTRHDVRNKLMAAKANIYLLEKKLGNQSELLKYVEGIDAAINQSVKIFEFSRMYEKIGLEESALVDVGDCFDEAVNLMPPKSSVKTINDCRGLHIMADSLLEQLFYTLIENSLKHGKKVTEIRLHYSNENGQVVKLVYEDDGVGIPKENKSRIFAEGFTTGGTGLGLKLAMKMIEVYGWTIGEDGVEGEGARFTLTIPAMLEQVRPKIISPSIIAVRPK